MAQNSKIEGDKMTKEEKLEANMACAKLLGYEDAFISPTNGGTVHKSSGTYEHLNIFDAGRFDWVRYELEEYTMFGGGKSNYETYEEAIGAACLKVTK